MKKLLLALLLFASSITAHAGYSYACGETPIYVTDMTGQRILQGFQTNYCYQKTPYQYQVPETTYLAMPKDNTGFIGHTIKTGIEGGWLSRTLKRDTLQACQQLLKNQGSNGKCEIVAKVVYGTRNACIAVTEDSEATPIIGYAKADNIELAKSKAITDCQKKNPAGASQCRITAFRCPGSQTATGYR